VTTSPGIPGTVPEWEVLPHPGQCYSETIKCPGVETASFWYIDRHS